MFRINRFRVIEVRYGTGSLEYPVMRAGTQAHAADGHLQRALARFVENAKCSEQTRRDAGVVESAAALNRTSGFHAGAHFPGRGSVIFAAQLFVRHGWNFDVQIDSIQQGSAYFTQVTLD